MQPRQAKIKRVTRETQIELKLNIDGSGRSSVRTGIPFFDHMLTLVARHSVVDLSLRCKGDLPVDAHHTVEDCGIALGQAFLQVLGDTAGIRRYGRGFTDAGEAASSISNQQALTRLKGEACVPMDETLARCVIDFSGRPYLVWRGLDKSRFKQMKKSEKKQDMSCAFRFGLAREFCHAVVNEARCNLHFE